MCNISNELLIESTEINLMVTEGLTDKSKKTFAAVIKKIKEFIRKVLVYIKSKLLNRIKSVDEVIKKVNKHEPIMIENQIIVPSPKKLDELFGAAYFVESLVHPLMSVGIKYIEDEYKFISENYTKLDQLYKEYKENIDESYTGDLRNILNGYQFINMQAVEIADKLKKLTDFFNGVINGKVMPADSDTIETDSNRLMYLSKVQDIISKTIQVLEFVSTSCLRGARTIASYA